MPGEKAYRDLDLQRLHQRIDDLAGKLDERLVDLSSDVNDLAVAFGKIETKLEMQPPPPSRPCDQLKNLHAVVETHIAEHKETRRLWQRPVVSMLVHLFELALVAGLTYAFTARAANSIPLPEITQPAFRQTTPQGN